MAISVGGVMNYLSRYIKTSIFPIILMFSQGLYAQRSGGNDTLHCFVVGFQVGTVIPSDNFSTVSLSSGGTTHEGNLHSLYDAPWLDFGITGFYKFKSNWLISIEGNLWFGNDNLSHRRQRMPHLYTREGSMISTGGIDPVVTCYNRHLNAQLGVGKIITLWPSLNPNSGLLLRLAAGWSYGQTVFTLNEENAPQIDGDYALIYDHQRQGPLLTQGVGIWFMSNRSNLINFHITFEVSELWSRSTRDYVYDALLGYDGKDNNHYFDLLYTIRLSWMFPLKGKTAREYYYY